MATWPVPRGYKEESIGKFCMQQLGSRELCTNAGGREEDAGRLRAAAIFGAERRRCRRRRGGRQHQRIPDRLAVIGDLTARGRPPSQYPWGSRSSLSLNSACDNAEVGGCAQTPGEEKRTQADSGLLPSLEQRGDTAGGGEEANDNHEEKDTLEREAPEYDPGISTQAENANISRHIPGGTWLLQVRAYMPTLFSILVGRKGGEGEEY
ncbi:hypothetical protein NDU88_002300 [Pleurodeles waltl]|uniref:Uncharacterized protein n=1 Tax=Pleurodeles waltl TaxID=8319 RepID=A0AAV7L392_PLEWA|nr:hypothetical protein NDU88_002300 [Pleurodeles waltl]